MKTFNSYSEIMNLTINRIIYLWTGVGFIEVTKKALCEMLRSKQVVRGTYEDTGSCIRLGF